MDDSDPTFSTDPSSSAIRARAFTWVFTRSCQSTAVLADAAMVFPLRAILTAGITRETSPARCPAACGPAQTSAGIEMRRDSDKASPKAYGDFVFIKDSPRFIDCIYRSYWRARDLSTQSEGRFAHSLYAFVGTCRRSGSVTKMKQRRSHIVMLLPPTGKTIHGGENPSKQLGWRIRPLRLANSLQPLDSELFANAIKRVRDAVRAEEH